MSNRELATSLIEGRGWVGSVKTVSTFPPTGLYTKSAEEIARVMATKKVSPKGIGSAIKMVQMHINRAGKNAEKYPDTWGKQVSNCRKAIAILQNKKKD